jgi:hypothetical protein|eukprot:evm.model.NODE_20051_length_6417_cov_39.354996.2
MVIDAFHALAAPHSFIHPTPHVHLEELHQEEKDKEEKQRTQGQRHQQRLHTSMSTTIMKEDQERQPPVATMREKAHGVMEQ